MLGLPVDGPHLGDKNHVRSGPGHTLANGQPCFRLSQNFYDVNPLYPQFGQHRALDAANYNCGAPIRAARAGMAYTRKDIYGALIVQIVHDGTWQTTYGHLSRWAIGHGGVYVRKGQIIGYNGTTGLSSGCHLHFEAWKYGVRVDPWPLLDQNRPAPTPPAIRVSNLPMSGFRPRTGYVATIKAGKPRRNGATLGSKNLGFTTSNKRFTIWGDIKGQDFGYGPTWYFGPQWVNGKYEVIYIPTIDLMNVRRV